MCVHCMWVHVHTFMCLCMFTACGYTCVCTFHVCTFVCVCVHCTWCMCARLCANIEILLRVKVRGQLLEAALTFHLVWDGMSLSLQKLAHELLNILSLPLISLKGCWDYRLVTLALSGFWDLLNVGIYTYVALLPRAIYPAQWLILIFFFFKYSVMCHMEIRGLVEVGSFIEWVPGIKHLYQSNLSSSWPFYLLELLQCLLLYLGPHPSYLTCPALAKPRVI